MTHFTRLLDLTSADEAYTAALAQVLAPCILRPRFESSLTMNERHSYRLVRDLFEHKEAIFGELKRQSSVPGLSTTAVHPRAISTDESNRRAAMEARQRAIVNRTRDKSPATAQRHRRDRSSGPENGRFPINVGSPTGQRRSSARNSLEVHSRGNSATATDRPAPLSLSSINNHNLTHYPTNIDDADATDTNTSETSSPSPAREVYDSSSPSVITTPTAAASDAQNYHQHHHHGHRQSISRGSRSSHTSVSAHRFSQSALTPPATSLADQREMKGVTLEDKPMDDD